MVAKPEVGKEPNKSRNKKAMTQPAKKLANQLS